jgi:hypothetical protein
MPLYQSRPIPLRLLATAGLGLWMAMQADVSEACTLKDGEQVPTVNLPLRHEARHDHTDYYAGLLTLALEKTAKDYGPCEVRIHEEIKPQARRYLNLAQQRGIDIIDATSSPERSERFRAIPVPLLKGLMGYRILFIRAGEQERFSSIRTLQDLQQFSAGQGTLWPDVPRLEHNRITVVTAHNYPSLFRMLRAGRFDFFPRGAQEILDEMKNFETEDLAIEQGLIVAYPSPVYFHVHKDNVTLAERVETGLQRAVEDGAFDEFFYNHYLIKNIFTELNFAQRRIIYLCSPDHKDQQFLNDNRFWVKPWPDNLCAGGPDAQKSQVN